MTSVGDVKRMVEQRACGRCEYCAMHQSLQGATFHVEHVTPRSCGGDSSMDNLAWACPGCNLHKSNRMVVSDPDTGETVPLYNPRTEKWNNHFEWQGNSVVPLTAIGRASIVALDLNHPRRIRIRQAESLFDLFPPGETSQSTK